MRRAVWFLLLALTLVSYGLYFTTALAQGEIPTSPPEVTEARWIKLYNDSTDIRLQITPRKGYQGIQPLNQVSVLASDGELTFRSAGIDPYLLLPPFPFSEHTIPVCRIEITSPADTDLQLFYLTKNTPTYMGNLSVSRILKKGHNVLYLPLSEPGLTGRLRLDPGSVAGDYKIHEIEIRAVPRTEKKR